ncbi:MAG: response regulator transcription factor [Bacteroidetes bacterium]|nr:response regulator transcription factor [Bacteroidota bacterium]
MDKNRISVLLVEDDPNLGLLLKDYLDLLDYNTTLCTNGKHGLDTFSELHFDLCIFDVMLPVMDGFALAAEIRKTNEAIPIIFLTARSMNEDRIRGFRIGCDDYITKPFSTEELSLRIQAILKRCRLLPESTLATEAPTIAIGEYSFDSSNMMLTRQGKKQSLTRKETALLKLLCDNMNNIVTREFALKAIWGDDDYFIGRSMDVFITKLRKYLKDDPAVSITNIHGTGFRLEVKGE